MKREEMLKIAEVRKNESDQIEIRMEGQKSFHVVEDPDIAAYCVYLMIKGPQVSLPKRLRTADPA